MSKEYNEYKQMIKTQGIGIAKVLLVQKVGTENTTALEQAIHDFEMTKKLTIKN